MTLSDWADARIHRMNWMDVGLLKMCVMAFALMLAKLWPPLLSLDWKIYGGIFLITYVPLAVKLMLRKDGHT